MTIAETLREGDEELRQLKWDLRFLRLAREVSEWSKDPSTKCGAVVARPDLSIASVGYNGFPRGCSDWHGLYDDRELKYERVVHAEVNAVLACKEPLLGYTLYSYPPANGPSCARCSAVIIQAGIKRVVHLRRLDSDIASRWTKSIQIGLDMFEEAGVEVVGLDPRLL